MRILFTNTTVASRSGTEILTRDLAIGLRSRGHDPVVFTSDPGAISRQIVDAGVPVIERLDEIVTPPDIIHGHQLVETALALIRFPSVPAIFVCHDPLIWHDSPPRVDQVRKFVAVDRNCLERMVIEAGVPADKTQLIYSALDMRRFPLRAPLPKRPGRALIFDDYARPGNLDVVKQACAQVSLPLDVIGTGAGTGVDDSENRLSNYDLVFAEARCALEAMAVGCGVILCDARGVGSFVTEAQFNGLREWNFGMRCLQQPLTVGTLLREIFAYDAAEAVKVTALVREYASLDRALDQYLALYQEVIEDSRRLPLSVGTEEVIRSIATRAEYLENRLRASQSMSMPALARDAGGLVRVELIAPPSRMDPGSQHTMTVVVENNSGESLVSTEPHAAHLSYRWISALTGECVVLDALRTGLLRDVRPHSKHEQTMNIAAPDSEGEFLLRVGLAKDFVWFCDHRVTVASGAVVEGAASLSQASAWSQGLEALRDADFNTLGFTFDRLPGMLTFVESESFVDKAVRNPFVSCVITTADLVSLIPERMGVAICSSPRRAFWDVHNHLAKLTSFYWTDFDSVISPTARIHPKSFVSEKNVIIGSGAVIHPNAVVLDRSIVGDGTEIYPGAVVGSIGFQTMRSGDEVSDLEHAGGVRIAKNTRILANAVIARGVFRQFTEIGKSVRVGNTAFVSHNSRIGDCAFIGHGAVVNGNVEVGEGAWIGPGASIVHGLSIGDHARVSLGSSVMRDVAPGESVMGAMALGNRRMLRLMASAGEKP